MMLILSILFACSLGLLKINISFNITKLKKHPGHAAKIQHKTVYITVYNYAEGLISSQYHTFP